MDLSSGAFRSLDISSTAKPCTSTLLRHNSSHAVAACASNRPALCPAQLFTVQESERHGLPAILKIESDRSLSVTDEIVPDGDLWLQPP